MSVSNRIAEILATNPAGMTVAQIATAIGASKPGTHRAMNKGASSSRFYRNNNVYTLNPHAVPVVVETAKVDKGFSVPAPAKDYVISGILSRLSPENLTCDGELSSTQVRARRSSLVRQLRAAVKGVDVTTLERWVQSEISQYLTPRSRPNNPACKSFSVGDRVEIRHGRRVIPGTVIRVNGKTLSVRDDDDSSKYYRATPGICFAI